MAGKTLVAIVVLVTALAAPCLVDSAGAAPIPGYFQNDWVGALCVQMAFTGSTAKVPVLILLTFDKVDNGGITLAKADQLFNFLKTQISFFIGASVTQTCALTPTQVNTQFHLNGLQAAQSLTGTYSQYGFVVLLILDSFWTVPPGYLGLGSNALSLRSDLFLTNGSNDIVYISSLETLQSFLQ